MALTTLSGVNDYNGWTTGDDTTRDDLVTSMINSISAQFETYTGRSFNLASYTEYYNGDGGLYLYLDQYPITVITSIWNDTNWVWGSDTLVSGTYYRIVDDQGVVFNAVIPRGQQNVKVSYTAGYATIPYDLELAATREVSTQYQIKKNPSIKSKTLPDGSVQYGGTGGATAAIPFRSTTMDTLDSYKKRDIL